MDNIHIIDIPFFVNPVINILVVFYQSLTWLHVPYALGFSIVLLTLFVKLLMYPLTTQQLKMTKKMQDLAPHMSNIRTKHKGDMKKQQEATLALYKEHNLNPAAGCLPMIVQLVVLFFGLYPALVKVLMTKDVVSTVNSVLFSKSLYLTQPWSVDFFGLNLGKTPADLFPAFGAVIFLIPVITGGLQFIQTKMMSSATPKSTDGKIVKKEGTSQEEFSVTLQKQMMLFIPFILAFVSWHFFIGLSLYWNTFTIFGIIQQYLVTGLGELEHWVAKIRRNK